MTEKRGKMPVQTRLAGGTIDRLLKTARALGTEDDGLVMPLEEIKLGATLGAQPRTAIPQIIELAADPNMHARRIAVSALHRMKAWDDPRVLDLLVERLDDAEGWVRYDAAWALGDSMTTDPSVLAGLERLASGAKKDPELDNGDERAKAQAAESLAALMK